MSAQLPNRDVLVEAGRLRGCPPDPAGIIAFKGVPYAAAPVGRLRWRPPQPVRPWQGTRAAGRFGARCPGARIPGLSDGAAGESEDCLTLNV